MPQSPPSAQPLDPRTLRRNASAWAGATALLTLLCAFGDTDLILPNLALRFEAAPWLAALPNVAIHSFGYLTAIPMSWLLLPHRPRRLIYALTLVLMYAPMSLLALALLLTDDPARLRAAFGGAILLFGLGSGLSTIPCWDLYARILPDAALRSRVMGFTSALTYGVGIVAAGGAAWLISTRSPLAYPSNYVAGLLLYTAGGLIYTVFLIPMREQRFPSAGPRPSCGAYLRHLAAVLRGDAAFRCVLLAATLGGTLYGCLPLLLAYAKRERGFTEDHVSALVSVRAMVMALFSYAAGRLGARWGAARVGMGLALLTALGVALTPLADGAWLMAPLLLAGVGNTIYAFAILATMECAPEGRGQYYLAILLTALIVPSSMPVVLALLFEQSRPLTFAALILLALAAAVAFRRAQAGAHPNPPAL